MPNIFGAAARAAVVRLVCPRCGEVQARARGSERTKYVCRRCRAVFSAAEGNRAEATAARRQRH